LPDNIFHAALSLDMEQACWQCVAAGAGGPMFLLVNVGTVC